MATENKHRVQDDVHHRSGQSGSHSEAGTAVGTDNRIHGLTKHIEWDAQGNPEEILLGLDKSFLIHPAPKHTENGFLEYQIKSRQNQADNHRQHHGVTNAATGVILGACSQADTDISAATIPYQYGNSQGHYCQRKHHCVGRVAIRAQVTCVGNEDLVYNVIQSSYQQRNDTGNSIPFHQFPNRLRFQERIGTLFHKLKPPRKKVIRQNFHSASSVLKEFYTRLANIRHILGAKKQRVTSNWIYAVKRYTL